MNRLLANFLTQELSLDSDFARITCLVCKKLKSFADSATRKFHIGRS